MDILSDTQILGACLWSPTWNHVRGPSPGSDQPLPQTDELHVFRRGEPEPACAQETHESIREGDAGDEGQGDWRTNHTGDGRDRQRESSGHGLEMVIGSLGHVEIMWALFTGEDERVLGLCQVCGALHHASYLSPVCGPKCSGHWGQCVAQCLEQ